MRSLSWLCTTNVGLCLTVALMLSPAMSAAQDKFVVEKLAEKPVEALPADPMYWHVAKFKSLDEAEAAAGEHALAAEAFGSAWLFSLGSEDAKKNGGEVVAAIGPIPRVEAENYLLRVNTGTAMPGAMTSIHTHPGVEAFYVLEGELTQRSPDQTLVLASGETAAGRPHVPMQVVSTGDTELRELIMFVVDADAPFSAPASLD